MPWKKHEPGIDLELTDRQQEVLSLIARGRTNPEIAAELGITLDGAKWHVREILSKLGVESREEAAAYWRAHQRPGRRLVRTVGGLASVGLAKTAAAAAVLVVVGLIATVTLLSLRTGDDAPAAPETLAPPPDSSPTAPDPTATTSPTPGVSEELLEPELLPGMFLEPRPTPVADIELSALPEPDPTFAWDGESTMIYERETGNLIDLGPGEPARFSSSGEWAAWVSGNRFEGDLHAINLQTGERKDLGEGGYVSHFLDDDRFVLDIQGTDGFIVSVSTGERLPILDRQALFDEMNEALYRLGSTSVGEYIERFEVSDSAGAVLLAFHAYRASFVDDSHLLVATSPVDGMTNFFLVDISAGTASFLATAEFPDRWYHGPMGSGMVGWTSDLCTEFPGTWLLDLATGLVRFIPGIHPPRPAPDGFLGEGSTGLTRLIERDTFEYAFVSPAGWPSWSSDYRYVSVGYVGGHGGYVCGPG